MPIEMNGYKYKRSCLCVSVCLHVLVHMCTMSVQETRSLSQFQYMAWPDHSIPLASDGLLGMMDMAQKVQASSAAPLVIHCRCSPVRIPAPPTDSVNRLTLGFTLHTDRPYAHYYVSLHVAPVASARLRVVIWTLCLKMFSELTDIN